MPMPEILVVDDEPPLVEFLTELLSAEGYRVRSAADGVAALAEVARRAPNLVLTDVMMPHLGGIALTKQLQEHQPPVPVVLVSAIRGAAPLAGVPFVPKPFDVTVLLAAVADALAADGFRPSTAGETPR